MVKKFLLLLLVLTLAAGVITNCSKKEELNPVTPITSDSSDNKGKISFRLLAAADEIASGVVTITKGSMTYKKPITIENQEGSVTFEDIQVGKWNILVQLFDADGYEIYTGTGTGIVNKDETTVVKIIVNHNTGNLEIDVEVPLPDGLILWNKLGSQTEVENSVTGPNGIISGTILFQPCMFDNGAYNNTADSYITFDGSFFTPNCFTFECWFKTDFDVVNGVAQDGKNHTLFGWYYDRTHNMTFYFKHETDEGLCFNLHNGYKYYHYFATSSDITFNAGTIHHIALVYDRNGISGGNDIVRMYLDGNLEYNSTTLYPEETNTGGIFYIGVARDVSIAYPFSGTIDNIKIYNYAKTDFSDRYTE